MNLISLEGNIGSGKESIIQFFRKYFKESVIFMEDSIYNWENEKLLKDFYKNPSRWGLTLEIYASIQKYKRLQEITENLENKNNLIITRRSPMSDKECFIKAFNNMKYVDEKENSIYEALFETFNIPKYNGIIYLKSNVNKCYENIISKQETFEKIIQFEYIQKLHQHYERWISNLISENIPIVIIDIEKYRDIDGNEKLEENLLNLLLHSFPILKKYLKVHGIYVKEEKWTTVTKKRNKSKK
jgi:deoxyadenosine/deoxycytidine kinase